MRSAQQVVRSAQRVSSTRELPQARLQRHRGLGDQPRLVADLLGRRRARAGASVRKGGVRRGHQLHRHRQRLRPRRLRDAARRSPRRARALVIRARHEGVLRNVAHRPRPVGGADPQADRRLPSTAADRLRRSLPVPPLRRADAAGGDDDRAHRGRARRQGASHRLQRVAGGADRRGACAPGRRALRLQPAAVLDGLAGARGRGDPAVHAGGHLPDRVVAARAGRAHRQVPPRRAAAVATPARRARR